MKAVLMIAVLTLSASAFASRGSNCEKQFAGGIRANTTGEQRVEASAEKVIKTNREKAPKKI